LTLFIMKSKTRTAFVCQECGYDTPKFFGKCPECGTWNSLKEFKSSKLKVQSSQGIVGNLQGQPQKLADVTFNEKSRMQTGFSELNTVLGGGLVLGSATLIAGDPGIGKSTLLLQICMNLAAEGKQVLYVSGEESAEQIKMRAERLKGTKGNWGENLLILATSDPDYAIEQVEAMKPSLVVLDSVQTMQSSNLEGLSGAVGQVRYTAMQFIRSAKQYNIPTIIVGHVTKEGMVAGPMVLSHMVDTVVFLEGEKFTKTRILRSLKNRFGPIDEVGIFAMEEEGLIDIAHPEQLFLTEQNDQAPGSVIVATLEGTRAFMVELQALVVYSKLAMPRRVVSGIDRGRVELLLAVLQKYARLPLDTMDVFVNVAGGMRLTDPGIDLGVCLALFSSIQNIALRKTVGIGEVGLLGEIRNVSGIDKRIREAEKLGYERIISAKKYKNIRQVVEALKIKEVTSPKS
jgi:DNA repair protein RadA/Sms